MNSHPEADPIKTFRREATTARRAGRNTRCEWCGETLLKALVTGSKPCCCAKCKRKMKGQTIVDKHHVAGKANSEVTAEIPVNDHRAVLSVAQHDWPRATLENPEGCPLRAAAGCIRGFTDTVRYLIDSLLRWIAEMLELLSEVLIERLGQQWWLDTPLAQFAREGKK